MYKLYTSSAKEISQCGKKDIERLIRQIDNAIRERELYELTKDLVCFLSRNENALLKKNLIERYQKKNYQEAFTIREKHVLKWIMTNFPESGISNLLRWKVQFQCCSYCNYIETKQWIKKMLINS